MNVTKFVPLFVILFLSGCSVSPPHTEEVLLQKINFQANSFVYITDQVNYGHSDYWATPEEFLAHKGGDCEDFALYKKYLINSAKISVEHINTIGVYAVNCKKDCYHVVLEVDGWILDNRFDQIYPYVSEQFFKEYLPVHYYFSEKEIVGNLLKAQTYHLTDPYLPKNLLE